MSESSSMTTAPKQRVKLLMISMAVLVSVVVGFIFLRSQAATILEGDLNGDTIVDQTDLQLLSKNLGMKGASVSDGDLDGNGTVDITDLSILTNNLEPTE